MPMTLEQFEANPEYMSLPYMERAKLMQQYGIYKPVLRTVEQAESGRIVKKRGVGVGTKIVLAEKEERIEEAPPPEIYFNGQFRFLPIPECEMIAERLSDYVKAFPKSHLVSVCLTCMEKLGDNLDEMYPVPCTRLRVIGAASDHVRTTINHAVVVKDLRHGNILYRSPYYVLKTCS